MTQQGKAPAAERPLTARSIVASALLGTHPPVLRGQLLVRLGELFGVSEGTTRVALSRMVAAGELTVDDGRYRLRSPALLARQVAQERGRSTPRRHWNGDWVMAVVVAEQRDAPTRNALRDAARALRLAELREGVWMRPDNLDREGERAAAVVDEQCIWMKARPADPVELAATLWDLDAWGSAARRLTARMKRSRASLDRRDFDAIPEGFVTSAAVLRSLRDDPLLPPELVGRDWPGLPLREVYEGYDGALRALLSSFFTPTPDRPSPRRAPARSQARRAPRAAAG